MSMTLPRGRDFVATAIFATALMTVSTAQAAGSNMPWEQPLNQILQSVEGPVAKIIAVIIIIVTGLSLAFGDTSGGFRRLIQIVFGLSIAFAASSFFLSFSHSAAGDDLMDGEIPGFVTPVHRALTEPILMGGAPRSIAIVNGTLAAALGIGLRLWVAGLLLWFVGHMIAVWAAKRDLTLSRSSAGTSVSPVISTREVLNDESCRIPPLQYPACRFSAVGSPCR